MAPRIAGALGPHESGDEIEGGGDAPPPRGAPQGKVTANAVLTAVAIVLSGGGLGAGQWSVSGKLEALAGKLEALRETTGEMSKDLAVFKSQAQDRTREFERERDESRAETKEILKRLSALEARREREK